jgi:hypothetical protein
MLAVITVVMVVAIMAILRVAPATADQVHKIA